MSQTQSPWPSLTKRLVVLGLLLALLVAFGTGVDWFGDGVDRQPPSSTGDPASDDASTPDRTPTPTADPAPDPTPDAVDGRPTPDPTPAEETGSATRRDLPPRASGSGIDWGPDATIGIGGSGHSDVTGQNATPGDQAAATPSEEGTTPDEQRATPGEETDPVAE